MGFWQEMLRIGSLEVPRFIGGPLDGITDSPFRRLVREFSKEELLFTEMRHVGSVVHGKGGAKALNFHQSERPLNYQISANNLDFLEQACQKILEAGVDAVDLNIGCPAKNVVRSGGGSALMADPEKLKGILIRLRAALPIPFTMKMRAGYKQVNAVEIAKLAQDCGVDAISIHPRLQSQQFEGRPHYTIAAEVKEAVTVPVIISGGVVNFQTAKMVYEMTGVDGFLIGRGIWGKPWKLREMREHAAGNSFEVTGQQIAYYGCKQLASMLEYYGERGLYAFRKHLPFYLRGKPGASEVRQRLAVSESPIEVCDGIRAFWDVEDMDVPGFKTMSNG